MTPLHQAAALGDAPAVQGLLAQGADPNTRNNEGETALHLAAANGHTEVMNLLLQKGMLTDVEDNLDRTPLFRAVLGGHLEAVLVLLQARANPHVKNAFGQTPSDFARFSRNPQIKECLKVLEAAESEEQKRLAEERKAASQNPPPVAPRLPSPPLLPELNTERDCAIPPWVDDASARFPEKCSLDNALREAWGLYKKLPFQFILFWMVFGIYEVAPYTQIRLLLNPQSMTLVYLFGFINSAIYPIIYLSTSQLHLELFDHERWSRKQLMPSFGRVWQAWGLSLIASALFAPASALFFWSLTISAHSAGGSGNIPLNMPSSPAGTTAAIFSAVSSVVLAPLMEMAYLLLADADRLSFFKKVKVSFLLFSQNIGPALLIGALSLAHGKALNYFNNQENWQLRLFVIPLFVAIKPFLMLVYVALYRAWLLKAWQQGLLKETVYTR